MKAVAFSKASSCHPALPWFGQGQISKETDHLALRRIRGWTAANVRKELL